MDTRLKRVTVLLADDHQIVRTGIAAALSKYDIDVVGQAKVPEEVVPLFEQLAPDVVILDIRFGEKMTGFDVASKLVQMHPNARFVFFSQFDQLPLIKKTYEVGAFAFVNKDCDERELADAVVCARHGKVYFQPQIAERLARIQVLGEQSPFSLLTTRELSIAKQMATGMTIAEIAECHQLSIKTVSNTSIAIKEKLCVHRQAELTILAARHNLIDL